MSVGLSLITVETELRFHIKLNDSVIILDDSAIIARFQHLILLIQQTLEAIH
ncbi:hypothetical protein [Alkalibacillus aidingensis]|uniref:hypothetical protein n=1 Tax=Alkalibacillus aidingensis TaxID=2747607 RepID=UPI001660191B|nr:hypothetical protein [Alkalibacillus aidingensis]